MNHVTRWISRRHPRYIRGLVYMLQATEYDVRDFFRWHERVKDFRAVEKRKQLVFTAKALGLYISGHPLEKHREKLEKSGSSIQMLNQETRDGMNTIVAGIIEEHRIVITKKNEHMAFVRVADFTGSIEVVVFPKTFTEVKEFLVVDKMVAIKGRFSRRNDSPSVIAEKVKALE